MRGEDAGGQIAFDGADVNAHTGGAGGDQIVGNISAFVLLGGCVERCVRVDPGEGDRPRGRVWNLLESFVVYIRD